MSISSAVFPGPSGEPSGAPPAAGGCSTALRPPSGLHAPFSGARRPHAAGCAGARKQRLSGRWAVVAALWALCAAPGCLSAPDAESLLAVGFRSPEQTFETFKTAVRGDLATLEYRCLSRDFRRANGLSAHSYIEGRRQWLAKNPFIKWVARARVVRSEPLAESAHEIEAVVEAFFTTRRLLIRFVRDDAIEVYHGEVGRRGELLYDDYVRFDDVVQVQAGDDGSFELRARERFTPYEPDTDPSHVGEVRFLQDWKIDSLEVLDSESSDPSP